jgi:hypothetical protein
MKQPHCPAEDPEATPAARQEKPQGLHAACRPPRNQLRTEKVLVALLFRGCGVVSKGIYCTVLQNALRGHALEMLQPLRLMGVLTDRDLS